MVYYEDELNDEFSTAEITPDIVDENYKYIHKNIFWRIGEAILFLISLPIKFFVPKVQFKIKYVGKECVKSYKNTGYFIYANHTQPFLDTFLPTNHLFPKGNALIVNPENVSMKGMKTLVKMLHAIPIPNNKNGMKNFLSAIEYYIKEKKYAVTIYPEAHIWPFCTWIRNFKAVSFKYPIKYNVPSFCVTNTYKKYKGREGEVQIVSYLDGPFFPDEKIENQKERQKDLRDRIYQKMCERAKLSDAVVVKYVPKE
jgi:1-acyl-sn-glycerol-3-phosphate acyltransferase